VKHELCQLQRTRRPASLQTQQLPLRPHGDRPRGDAHWRSDTRNGFSVFKNPRLPRPRQGNPIPPKQGSDPGRPSSTNLWSPRTGWGSPGHPGTSALRAEGQHRPGAWRTRESAQPTHPSPAGTGGCWEEIYM